MTYLVILASMFLSGFAARWCAKRPINANLSILAGVVCGFGFYILMLLLHVDEDNLGMLLGLGFVGLIVLFAGAGWLGVKSVR